MQKFLDVIAKLRSPTGCPWDQKQTHKSLVPYLKEEIYEVIDEIESNQHHNSLKEELGDVLLQIVLHAQIASEEGRFDFQDIVECITEKMIRRHPHVFEHSKNLNESELNIQWEEIKKKESNKNEHYFARLSKSAPAIENSEKMNAYARSLGFDWSEVSDVICKFKEELMELEEAIANKNIENIEEEIGDLFFTLVNISHHSKVDPEIALKKANEKFKVRFLHVEKAIEQAKKEQKKLSLEEMEVAWNEAKNI